MYWENPDFMVSVDVRATAVTILWAGTKWGWAPAGAATARINPAANRPMVPLLRALTAPAPIPVARLSPATKANIRLFFHRVFFKRFPEIGALPYYFGV
jgi:hypothetical protein